MNALQLATSAELASSLERPLVTPSTLPPGLHDGFDEEAYHWRELGVVSKGAIDYVLQTPAHYLAWVSGSSREPDIKPFAFGRALHMRALEPLRFESTYLVEPNFGPCRKTDVCSSEQAKENKTRRDEWRVEHKGATVLDAATGMATLGMVEAIADHPLARPLLEGGRPELTLRWDDPETGLVCKGRADYLNEDYEIGLDVKSAADASLDAFKRSVLNFGYHRQKAHYSAGFAELGRPLRKFVFVVVEKTPPFAVALYELDRRFDRRGAREVRSAKRTLRSCLKHNVWPGYPEKIQQLQLPTWVKDEDDE